MKLVESDRPGPADTDESSQTVTPPRPEHRRVSVSLALTTSVLVGTVVAVYLAFPERHNLLVTRALELHSEPPAFQLGRPASAELAAWGVALFESNGREVPWPAIDGAGAATTIILGATDIFILKRRTAVVRYQVAGAEMTLVVQQARDVPPRTHKRVEGELSAVSWRKGTWTFVAVGRTTEKETWGHFAGAP